MLDPEEDKHYDDYRCYYKDLVASVHINIVVYKREGEYKTTHILGVPFAGVVCNLGNDIHA